MYRSSEFRYSQEGFEGPLDVLLMLIAKHKMDILHIDIASLLGQFLLFLDESQASGVNLSSEFIEIAAHLIYIKTIALLPRHEEEEAALKRELTGALIEYSLCKEVAGKLRLRYNGAGVFTRKPQTPDDNAYRGIRDKRELSDCMRLIAKILPQTRPVIPKANEIVAAPIYASVFAKVVHVLKNLRKFGQCKVSDISRELPRSEQVAVFLALLELVKSERIAFSDDNAYLELVNRREPAHSAV
jgi:segregation and condensation protein A